MQKNSAFARGHRYALSKANLYPKLLFLMKVSVVNCAVILLSVQLFAARLSKGQSITSTNITFGVKNEDLRTTLKKLREQSGYILFYPSAKIERYQQGLTIPHRTRTVASTLDLILSGTSLTYSQQNDGTIVIFDRPPLPVAAAEPASKAVIISGRVVDRKGLPLPGASIRIKGTQRVVVTDIKGSFMLLALDGNEVLQFSYIGFRTREIPVKGVKNPLTVVLEDAAGTLDEIQVTAYGQTTKRLNTGDQTTITAAEIEKYPVSNALVALQATVPGLLISQSTGSPGSTYKVNIRGLNSIGAESNPFYVIDGVPYSGGSFSSQRGNTLSADSRAFDALSLINPQDIESINILKDADATAIYGARGANGVILITTKKGKPGAARLNVNVFTGAGSPTRMPKLLNTKQYLEIRREAKKNDNASVLPTDYDINGVWDTTRYTDYSKVFLDGTGVHTNAQLSFSGGSDQIQYMVSGNYRKQSNVQELIGKSDKTSSMHFNLSSAAPGSRFSMNFTGGYTYTDNDIPGADLTSSVTSLAPNSPELFNPDGTLNFENNTFSNPLLVIYRMANTSITNLTSSLLLGYQLVKGLNLQVTGGYNKQAFDEFLGSPTTSFSPSVIAQGAKPSSRFSFANKMYWSVEPQANYTTNWSKGILNIIIGGSLQKQLSNAQQLQATGYNSDLLLRNIAGGTSITPFGAGYNISKYKYSALFGRVNYNWADKYILNLSGRYDGSSKFGRDRRFHFFPSAGLSWIFSSESFVQNALPFLSFGKIRASYGITGNDQISNYSYYTNYNLISGPAYQGVPGVSPVNLPNDQLSWETVAKTNIGGEFQFLKGRIGLEGNYFYNRTSDMILGTALASTTGFTSISENLGGKVVNKGFDLTLNTQNIRTSHFTWSTTLLFTRMRNSITEYPDLSPAQTNVIGQAVNVQRVYRYAGVNPETGLYQFYDRNGNITDNPSQSLDLTETVDINPDYFGSVQNALIWKGISLSFLFRYIKQTGTSVRGELAGSVFPGFMSSNIPGVMLNRWQKPGDDAVFQKYSTGITAIIQQSKINRLSDVYYGDASYIRLQNVSLGYQVPQQWAARIRAKALRVYANGENLATISNYGILDPENQSLLRMPPLRTIVFGVQATF